MNVAELTHERIYRTADGNGVSCNFVKMDESRGIKFYRDPQTRDEVMSRQKLGAMYGFAPKVGEVVDLPSIGYYGFEVELVRIARFEMPKRYIDKELPPNVWRSRVEFTGNKAYLDKRDELIDNVNERLGFSMHDGHYGNIGFTDSDRMVIIDWGTESVANVQDGDEDSSEQESSECESCQCELCHPSNFPSHSDEE